MPAPISLFGAFHTAISLSAVGFGLWELVRRGQISLRSLGGRLFAAAMLIGSLTAFGIFRHGGFTTGHALSAITLLLLAVAALAAGTRSFGRLAAYVETLSLSASFLLLWVFTTTETLTRLPVGHPIAAGPQSPILVAVHAALLLTFAVGFAWQVRLLGRSTTRLD
jgi:uncharacterized membrane protein